MAATSLSTAKSSSPSRICMSTSCRPPIYRQWHRSRRQLQGVQEMTSGRLQGGSCQPKSFQFLHVKHSCDASDERFPCRYGIHAGLCSLKLRLGPKCSIASDSPGETSLSLQDEPSAPERVVDLALVARQAGTTSELVLGTHPLMRPVVSSMQRCSAQHPLSFLLKENCAGKGWGTVLMRPVCFA